MKTSSWDLDLRRIDAKYYTNTTQVQFDKHTLHSNNLWIQMMNKNDEKHPESYNPYS